METPDPSLRTRHRKALARIIKLESAMQEFVDWLEEPRIVTPQEMEEWMIAAGLKFKQLLKKESKP